MKRVFFSLAGCFLVLVCASCRTQPPLQIDVNGLAREYRLFVPAELPSGETPLLIAVHGGSGRADDYPQESRFEELAAAEGFIIAYPLSELLPGNEGEWQLNTSPESRQDLDFIEALIDEVSAQHPVDPGRVYATGYSLGSMFTYELACHLGDRFAAIASHAGSMPVVPNSCDPEENSAIMHLHGTQDEIIPYDQDWDWKDWAEVGTMRSVPNLVQFWADVYGCQDSQESTVGMSTHVVHDGCGPEVRVEHHRLEGVGHEWPDGIEGTSTHEVVWSFLQEFSRTQ